MIARIVFLLLLIIIIPDIYLYKIQVKRGFLCTALSRFLWWIPSGFLTIATLLFAFQRSFIPDNMYILFTYVWIFMFIAVSKCIYAVFYFIGDLLKSKIKRQKKTCTPMAWFVITLILLTFIYGSTIGIRQLNVKHITITSPSIPTAFDGYKIAAFSDAHVGTYRFVAKDMITKVVDSINAHKPDLVVFLGDLQNVRAYEIKPFIHEFKRLSARDGVYSVMGNHDYSHYLNGNEAENQANIRLNQTCQKAMGWHLLLNQSTTIAHSGDTISLVGEENDGNKSYFAFCNRKLAHQNVSPKHFCILLQHDPHAWESEILTQTHADLTLSGHTHGGQMSLCGWRPTKWFYKQDLGLYNKGKRYLYVTSGVGQLMPFRLGMPCEITIITLKKRK